MKTIAFLLVIGLVCAIAGISEAKRPNPAIDNTVILCSGYFIAVDAVPKILPADETSTSAIVATVKTCEGDPVPGEEVKFSISPDEMGSFLGAEPDGTVTDITDSEGKAEATYIAGTAPGTATITATDISVCPHISDTVAITLIPVAELLVTPEPDILSADAKSISKITATLTDGYGYPIEGAEITFKEILVEEQYLGHFIGAPEETPHLITAITNEQGEAQVHFKVYRRDGTATIEATYQELKATCTIDITALMIKEISWKPKSPIVGEIVKFNFQEAHPKDWNITGADFRITDRDMKKPEGTGVIYAQDGIVVTEDPDDEKGIKHTLNPDPQYKFTEPGTYWIWFRIRGNYKGSSSSNLSGLEQAEEGESIWGKEIPKASEVEVELDHDIWWFDGADAKNYDEAGTLTAQGVTKGTFKWDVIAGKDKVNLNNNGADADSITAEDDPTVTIKSTGASGVPNDVTVRLTYNGVAVCDYSLSVFAPNSVEMMENYPKYKYYSRLGGAWRGWIKTFKFQIHDQFGNPLTKAIENNEKFGAVSNRYPGENWSPPEESGKIGKKGKLTDRWELGGPVFIYTPTLLNRTKPNAATIVYRVPHEYRAGSTTPGSGRLVKSHTMRVTRGEPIIE